CCMCLYMFVFFCIYTSSSGLVTISLHDALPISGDDQKRVMDVPGAFAAGASHIVVGRPIRQAADPVAAAEAIQAQIREHFEKSKDRKSTRLNSSHVKISYAVFCLKQKTYMNEVR